MRSQFQRALRFLLSASAMQSIIEPSQSDPSPDLLLVLVAAPDFLNAAQDRAARAPFCKERRMKSDNANNLYRKSGLSRLPRSFF
jgi:hypothetical protein